MDKPILDTQQLLNDNDDIDLSDIMSSQPSYRFKSNDQSITHLMRIVWINEKNIPDLLRYEDDIVNHAKNKIFDIMAKCDKLSDDSIYIQKRNNNNNNNTDMTIHDIMISMRRLECDRLRYMLHDYLRVRLHKIRTYSMYIASDTDMFNQYLSAAEQKYCTSFIGLYEQHINDICMNNLPHNKFKNLVNTTFDNIADMAAKPNLKQFVIFRCVYDINELTVGENTDDQHTHVLESNDIILGSYHNFKHLLEQTQIEML